MRFETLQDRSSPRPDTHVVEARNDAGAYLGDVNLFLGDILVGWFSASRGTFLVDEGALAAVGLTLTVDRDDAPEDDAPEDDDPGPEDLAARVVALETVTVDLINRVRDLETYPLLRGLRRRPRVV